MRGKPLSAYVLICEKLLQEESGIVSLIRVVDLFYVAPLIENVPEERQAITIDVLGHFVLPSEDDGTHVAILELIRPSGERTEILRHDNLLRPPDAPKKAPEAPSGYNVGVELRLRTKEHGTHRIVLSVDDAEAAQTFFTLLPLSVRDSS
jgi:hypothetical protein